MLLLTACGGSPASNAGANPLEAMSLQADDVPAGLHLCSQSGDMTKILSEFKAKNLPAWDTVRSTWHDLEHPGNGHPGATGGWWQLYASSQAACDSYFAQGYAAFSQETPLVTRMMISTITQFPDSESAFYAVSNGYGKYMGGGFGPNIIARHQPWYPDGTKLGVGPNSVFHTTRPGSGETPSLQGDWLNKSFLLSLTAYNIPPLDAEPAVSKMNARVP